jgi:mRNA-degrading endonuclease YafQ of YafQ-DinJ toxin-antitoxin module
MARKSPLKLGLWNYFDSSTDFGRQLNSFEPNIKFQRGHHTSSMSLADLVKTLKTDLDVKKVYCWHALHGYWRGATDELGHSIGINVTQVFTKPSSESFLVKLMLHALFCFLVCHDV